MSADQRPYVPEQLPPVTITDEAERDYFKNLSGRLLSTIGCYVVALPPATGIGVFLIGEGAQRVGFDSLASLYSDPAGGALTGLAVGVVLSAREIWKVRKERFPRE